MGDGNAGTINPKDLIDCLGKGMRLIEAFDEEHPRLSASEAAAATGLTRTAARHYLLSLRHFGYAATDGKRFVSVILAARAQQHWSAEQQLDAGYIGVALPARNLRGVSMAAASMTLPAQTWPSARIVEHLLPGLRDLAQLLRPLIV